MVIFTLQYVIFAQLVYYIAKDSRHDGVFLEQIEAETIIFVCHLKKLDHSKRSKYATTPWYRQGRSWEKFLKYFVQILYLRDTFRPSPAFWETFMPGRLFSR